MAAPSSVFIPAGAVRSKIRQEQRLYDVHCELLLKELREKKRAMEQFKRRVKLELSVLEDAKDGPGYQYTGYFPSQGPSDPASYDIRVTRPRNRIPLRKVCTYKMDSIRDADTATPIVVTARRTLSRLRNTASVLQRRNQVRLKARSLSAPGGVVGPEVASPSSTDDRKSVATVDGQVLEQKPSSRQEESASKLTLGSTKDASEKDMNVKRTIRKVVKHVGEIDVDISAILATREPLQDTTKVFQPLERSMVDAKESQAALAETTKAIPAPQRKVVPRKIRIIAKERPAANGRKTTGYIKAKVKPETTTPRNKPTCSDRQQTPLPYKRYVESANLVCHDMDNVVTDIAMRGRQSKFGGESVTQGASGQDQNNIESTTDQGIIGKSKEVELDKVGSHLSTLTSLVNGQVENLNGTVKSDMRAEEENTATKQCVTWVEHQSEAEGRPTQGQESAPGHRAKSGERKPSRVSFNEDVVVANYYDDADDDDDDDDEQLFWTSEDDDRLDDELMCLQSPPSDMESEEEEASDGPGVTKLHLMYGGTQKLKSHGGEGIRHPKGLLRNDLNGEQLKGPTGSRKPHTAPLVNNKEKRSAPSLYQSGTFDKNGRRRKRQQPIPPASLQTTLKINGVSTSMKNSPKAQTATGKMKQFEEEMHKALSNLEISGGGRGRTFTITSPSHQQSPSVPLQATRGQFAVPGGVRSRVRRPSATEARQRARRPSAQLLQVIERQQADMSTAERLQVARQRQGPQ